MQLFIVFLQPGMISCNVPGKQPIATPPHMSYSCQRPAFLGFNHTHTEGQAAIRVQVHQMLIPVSKHQGKHEYFVNLAAIYAQT